MKEICTDLETKTKYWENLAVDARPFVGYLRGDSDVVEGNMYTLGCRVGSLCDGSRDHYGHW